MSKCQNIDISKYRSQKPSFFELSKIFFLTYCHNLILLIFTFKSNAKEMQKAKE